MATLTIADLDNGKRDLQTVDAVANSRAATATTRRGQQTTTLYEAIRRISEAGDNILRNLGFQVPVPYAPGIIVDSATFTVVGPDGGIFAAQAGQIPFTTGSWNPDQWYSVQNEFSDRKPLVFETQIEAEAAASVISDGTFVVALDVRKSFEALSGALVGSKPLELEIRSDSYGDGVASLQAAASAASNNLLRFAPGTYDGDFDVTFAGKSAGSTGVQGALQIDMTGVKLTGTGRLIFDGCKRVTLIGLDAPGFDIAYRGVWWEEVVACRFRNQLLGDAPGSNFQSNYWNSWRMCQFQSIVTGASATYNNKFDWYSCTMRGNTGQGFTGTQDYALNFNGNQNAQGWNFWGGDISYHNLGIWKVDSGNAADIELTFDGVYFDTFYPLPLDRARTRMVTRGCHSANNFSGAVTMAALSRGSQDSFRQDRACAWSAASSVNMIPNGDLREGRSSWIYPNGPVGATGGATITELLGVGHSGRALRFTQPRTSGTILLRPKPVAYRGRHLAALVFRNGEPGTRVYRVSYGGLFEVVTASDSEWSYWTLTTGAALEIGAQPDIQILSNDGTPFVIDVAYVGVTHGEGGQTLAQTQGQQRGIYSSSGLYNPPSIANGASVTTTLPAPGVVPGDAVVPTFDKDLQGVALNAYVSASGIVTCVFSNLTGAAVDLPSGTLRAYVTRFGV